EDGRDGAGGDALEPLERGLVGEVEAGLRGGLGQHAVLEGQAVRGDRADRALEIWPDAGEGQGVPAAAQVAVGLGRGALDRDGPVLGVALPLDVGGQEAIDQLLVGQVRHCLPPYLSCWSSSLVLVPLPLLGGGAGALTGSTMPFLAHCLASARPALSSGKSTISPTRRLGPSGCG